MPRFFSVTAFAGRLSVEGLPDCGPWDPRRLVYWDERQVDMILNPRIGDRKAITPSDIQDAVATSRLRHPAIKVWIAEGLEEEVEAFYIRPEPS